MKRYILFLIIALPFILQAQSILPDHTWHDPASTSHSKWYTADFGSTAFSYNGQIFAFNYWDEGSNKGGHTYVFTINKKHDYSAMAEYKLGTSRSNKLVFGYKNEGESMSPGPIIGRTFGFLFNNRMWYFQHVHELPKFNEYHLEESYECFALFPLDTMQSCTTYYETFNPPPDITKLGAFQLDSNLYFIGTKLINDDGYCSWYIQEYGFNSSNNRFSHTRDMEIGIVPTTHDMLSGIIKRLDKDGNEYIVFSSYKRSGMGTSDERIFMLKPYISDNVTEFTCTNFTTSYQLYNSAMALIGGSIKGNRTSDANHYYTDRFTSFSICENENSDGIHPVYAMEFGIDDCQGECPVFSKYLYSNAVTIPVSTAPSRGAGDYFQMVSAYELVPEVYTQSFGGQTDGYQQNVWVFYPDADKHWNAVIFTSDHWRLTNDSIVNSADLYNKELYPGIDDLWSLIGICDGGPPISLDWEVWGNSHVPGTEPTELTFTYSAGEESHITSSYEDQWSVGENMKISRSTSNKLEGSISEHFKYSSTYKHVISNSNAVEQTLSIPFTLMESNQDTAVLIWAVPSLIRYPYSTYPWWDTDQTNPVPYSFQYLVRTTGMTLIEENVGINEYPFNIQEPNDPSMDDWKQASRPEIQYAILNQGAQPIINATWENNQEGKTYTYSITDNSSDSQENSSHYEITGGASVTVPKVFKLTVGVSGSYEVQYSTDVTTTTKYGSAIDCDLSHLKTDAVGPNVSSLNLSIFWFRNEEDSSGNTPDWWYWSAYDDQRPWYIAYINNKTKASIQLQSPSNGDLVDGSDLYFSWMADGAELDDYTLVIANDGYIYNGSIIYRQSLGKAKSTTLQDFRPEKGKTYYWSVTGKTSEGQMVWSDIRSFTSGDGQYNTHPELMALVYPNPAGHDDLHIAITPVDAGNITIQLTDLNSVVVTQEVVKGSDGLPIEILFSGLNLPAGIYLAVIRSDNEQVVKKVVVK